MVRRVGAELDNALLDAAWQQLVDEGYAAFTMDAVAARAGTSRAVLYRRWADKHELVRAVVAHVTRPDEMTIADTGSLRGDTIAMMKIANRTRLELVTAMSVHLGATTRRPVRARQICARRSSRIGRTSLECCSIARWPEARSIPRS